MSAAAPHHMPAPGTVIAGKYRVERALGVGGMGVVVEATHLMLGQRVAMKLLHAQLALEPENKARFLREARIAAQLPPDHIARVSDVGETEAGEPYLVMELLTGRDLASELSTHGPLPVPAAVDLILQACKGVSEAHAVGLVHRDLKPANLFLALRRGEPPVVKVLDFGLSKARYAQSEVNLTQTDTCFGTPAYMSPEQIRSAKHVEPRSDQHALGAILYELLTGRAAYGAESLTALAVEISTAPSPSARAVRPEVPAGLDAAIRQALAKAPAGRFPNLAEFAAAIAPFGGPQARAAAVRIAEILASKRPDSVLSTSPTTSVSRYPRAIRRRPLIAVVAIGVLVGAGIVALTRGSGDDGPQRGPLVTTETPAAVGATVVPSPAAAEPLPAPVATATATAAPSATATRASPPERKKPVKKTGGTSKPSALPSPGEVFGGGP